MSDQLQQSINAVLNKYDKDYQSKGVLANLHEWEREKCSLLELLRKHTNWNEDALAVIFEVTENRAISSYEVHRLIDTLVETTRFGETDFDTTSKFSQALYSAVSGYSKFISNDNAVEQIKAACEVKCSVGQKTSRVINNICQKFGIDKHPEYNALFAKLADSLNPLQVRKKALLSIHSCDYLEMSSRSNSWNSCHSLNGGEYHGGTLSYMNDRVSMIFYTVDNDVESSFYSAPKRTR